MRNEYLHDYFDRISEWEGAEEKIFLKIQSAKESNFQTKYKSMDKAMPASTRERTKSNSI